MGFQCARYGESVCFAEGFICMIRYLSIANGCVWERGPLGTLRCYSGEDAKVMALVLCATAKKEWK